MHRGATHLGGIDRVALLGLTFSFTSSPHSPRSRGGDYEVGFQVLPLRPSGLTQPAPLAIELHNALGP